MRKLKQSEIKEVRESLWQKQGGRCAICQSFCDPDEAVLDHDHGTGAIRTVLHRTCNSMLGKIENHNKRYRLKNLRAFLGGASDYLDYHERNRTGMIHPSFKTEEDKRLRRNMLARKRRAAKKKEN